MKMIRFEKRDNVLGPGFRKKLNSVSENGAQSTHPGQGSGVQFSSGVTYSTPHMEIALCQVKSGETWSAGTTGGVTDDVNSAICELVYLTAPGALTDPNEYAESGAEVTVYNSIDTTEPTSGVFFAVLNEQSGRMELLI